MKMYKKTLFVILLIISFVFLLFSKNNNQNETTNNPKVCILYSKSKYKEKLTNELEESLKKSNVTVIKDTFKNINNYDPKEYDAVILLSGVAAFSPYPQATKYIKKHNYASNIVYFCAAFVKDAIYGFLDKDKVDAITAASEDDNIDETAQRILKRIYNLISKT